MPNNKFEKTKKSITLKPKIEKKLYGLAITDSKDKTVKVRVDRVKINTLYQKRFVQSKKYLVHTEREVKKGESVVIMPVRPISKLKKYKIV